MSIAQRMLYDFNLRPGEIARDVGYRDIYQFSKQFNKTFGVSPIQYRKQHREL
jgi:YesN/AraC family two-component response regulator